MIIWKLLFKKFFTPYGRSSRKEYTVKILIFTCAIILSVYTEQYVNSRIAEFFHVLVLGVVIILLFLQYFPLAIRRLHDLNASGCYVLLTFAPFGQLLILWLMFKQGTSGPNKYGEPPEY